MQPYMVDSVRAADLQILSQTRPAQLRLAMSAANAAKLRQMMIGGGQATAPAPGPRSTG